MKNPGADQGQLRNPLPLGMGSVKALAVMQEERIQ